jgi:hypothetical protein
MRVRAPTCSPSSLAIVDCQSFPKPAPRIGVFSLPGGAYGGLILPRRPVPDKHQNEIGVPP